MRTWFTRWRSIRPAACWRERETAATFSPSLAKISFVDLLKASASQVTAFAEAPGGGLYASTSNLGKVFLLGGSPESEGSYESDVFDAKVFSRWGRAEFRGAGNVELFARSGNVDNPDRNWSPWKPVDLQKDPELNVPPARFIQWKAVLHAGNPAPSVDSVLLNYLPKNVAPDFDDVTVQVGMRYQPLPKPIGVPDTSGNPAGTRIRFDAPPPSTRDSRFHRREMDGPRRQRRPDGLLGLLSRRRRKPLAAAERQSD